MFRMTRGGGINPDPYLREVFQLRYFVIHLARSDLRARYKKSYIGLLWAILNPIILTVMMTVILSLVFKTPARQYSAYVLVGLVCWEFLTQSSVAGSLCFLSAESYIKQYKRPLLIYPLRQVLVASVAFFWGLISAIIWSWTIAGSSKSAAILALPLSSLLSVIVFLPLVTIFAVATTIFRDFGQITAHLFQLLWYLSPVFISVSVFESSSRLTSFLHVNPVYHYLELFRQPILNGEFPGINSWLTVMAYGVGLWIVAIPFLRFGEKKLIYYI